MPSLDIANIVTSVQSPVQLGALALVLAFLFACLAWLKPRGRR